MMGLSLYDAFGLAGSAVVIVAYFATQKGWLSATDWKFPFSNVLGCLLIITSFLANWNLSAFLVEVFWLAISIYGLVRARRARSH